MTITGRTDVGTPAGTPTRPVRRWFDVVTGVGLLVIVAGTFLPWLRSGTAERTSYSADGQLRNVFAQHGVTGAVLMAWPFLSMLCALALVLLIVHLPRSGMTLAGLCASAAGIVCIRVLHTHSNMIIAVAAIGPGVTFAGCLVVLGAVVLVLLRGATGVALSHRSRRIR